jgi:hypothetical protein
MDPQAPDSTEAFEGRLGVADEACLCDFEGQEAWIQARGPKDLADLLDQLGVYQVIGAKID